MTKEERMEYQREYRKHLTDRQKELYRETDRISSRRRRQGYRERGLCIICGSPKENNYSICSHCREYQRERARRMKYKEGLQNES